MKRECGGKAPFPPPENGEHTMEIITAFLGASADWLKPPRPTGMRFGRRCLAAVAAAATAAAAAAAAGASAPARRTTFAPRYCPLSLSYPFSPLSHRLALPHSFAFVTGALRLPPSYQAIAVWPLTPTSLFPIALVLVPFDLCLYLAFSRHLFVVPSL